MLEPHGWVLWFKSLNLEDPEALAAFENYFFVYNLAFITTVKTSQQEFPEKKKSEWWGYGTNIPLQMHKNYHQRNGPKPQPSVFQEVLIYQVAGW